MFANMFSALAKIIVNKLREKQRARSPEIASESSYCLIKLHKKRMTMCQVMFTFEVARKRASHNMKRVIRSSEVLRLRLSRGNCD